MKINGKNTFPVFPLDLALLRISMVSFLVSGVITVSPVWSVCGFKYTIFRIILEPLFSMDTAFSTISPIYFSYYTISLTYAIVMASSLLPEIFVTCSDIRKSLVQILKYIVI